MNPVNGEISKSESNKHNRISYFDFLRGVAILMVVGIHTYPDTYTMTGGISDFLSLFTINFLNCAVPLFLALSGFFIARRKFTSFSDISSFWKKQIPVVYIPCLIFSLPMFVNNLISINCSSSGGVIKTILNYFLCGYSIYYFIALIIQCYLLAPVLIKYDNKRTLLIVAVISLISIIFLDYIRFAKGIDLKLIIRGSFPPLLIFFYIGIFLSRRNRNYSLLIPIIMIVIGLIVGMMQTEFIREHYGISGGGQKVSLYLFDVGFILFCLSQKVEKSFRENRFTKILLYIGEISFGIYFTHPFMIRIVRSYIPLLQNQWIIPWLMSVLLTILFIAGIKKIVPEFSRKYLGYR